MQKYRLTIGCTNKYIFPYLVDEATALRISIGVKSRGKFISAEKVEVAESPKEKAHAG